MADFSITDYKQAIGGIIAGVVLAFFGVDGYRSITGESTARVSSVNAEMMEKRINHKLLVQDFLIRRDMPPENTRQRIKAIENCLEHNCTEFISPTTEW